LNDEKGNYIPGTYPPPDTQTAPPRAVNRTNAEIGSPEFAEDRTQVNSLNNKYILERPMNDQNTQSQANQGIRDQLGARLVQSFDELLGTSAKLTHAYLDGVTARNRYVEGWEYSRMYDVANPVAVGSGANVTAGAVPANRIVDTTGAVAGAGVSASIGISALNQVTTQLMTEITGVAAQATALTKMVNSASASQYDVNQKFQELHARSLGLLGAILERLDKLTPANPTPVPASA
jgi:hypothetical protein